MIALGHGIVIHIAKWLINVRVASSGKGSSISIFPKEDLYFS